MPFEIRINQRTATVIVKGERIGRIQKFKKAIDTSQKRVHYLSLRQAIVEAPRLEADLKESPKATVLVPVEAALPKELSGQTLPLSQYIELMKQVTPPPEIPLLELGSANPDVEWVEETPAPPQPAPPAQPHQPAPQPQTAPVPVPKVEIAAAK